MFHKFTTARNVEMKKFYLLSITFTSTRSAGASDRSFYPIFNKKFDHLETLLTIRRPQESFVNWVTVRAFSTQSPV